MAVDEIDGETHDNINVVRLSTISIALDNQLYEGLDKYHLDKGEKSIRSNSTVSTTINLSYTDEDHDVIILESEDPSGSIVIIDDDDELREISSKAYPTDSSTNKEIVVESPEKNSLHKPQHQVAEDILVEENNDGLKSLSELSGIVFCRTSANLVELGDEAVTHIENSGTGVSYLGNKYTKEHKNSFVKDIQEDTILPTGNKTCDKEGRQVELNVHEEDIKFHLNRIFENNGLFNEEMKPSSVVVTMDETPIIISENGVITVIYKPEKVKFRRKIENSETSNRKSPTKTYTFRNTGTCSSSKRPEHHNSHRQIKSSQHTNNSQNGIIKTDKEDRYASVKRQQISGIRWTKKKYPPIRKVKFDGKMVYKCKDCDFVHPSKVAALRRHMIRHQSEDSTEWFYCDLCDYRAKRKGNLKVHMILHRNPDEVVWFKCETCGKKFKHRNGLYAHEKRHIKREELELYLCDQCSYKTPFKHTLLRHKINHEPTEKKKLLSCSMCSYSTYNKYYLSRHRQTHSEPIYKCLLCSYEAKYKVNLESHMKRHFPQDEILYCDSCDYSTNRRYTLTLHNRNVHNFYNRQEDQIFFCYNCSFQTRFKRCLVKHMSIHCGIEEKNEMITRVKTEIMTD